MRRILSYRLKDPLFMPVFALLWQTTARTGSVNMAHRCQCVEAINICRGLRDDPRYSRQGAHSVGYRECDLSSPLSQPARLIASSRIERLACDAIDYAASVGIEGALVSTEVESPFKRFREAITRLPLILKGKHVLQR